MSPDSHTVEGIARVVSIDGAVAWLEPEQTSGCGSCASSSSCGAKGIGTVASRIAARRFPLDNPYGLQVGERVVIGVDERSLLKASLTAYAIPLLTALMAGGIAEGTFGSDLVTMGAMACGLGLGLLVARIAARHLAHRGDLAPRFLRISSPFKGEAGRGMGEETDVPSACHASLPHPLPNPPIANVACDLPLEGEGAPVTLSMRNLP